MRFSYPAVIVVLLTGCISGAQAQLVVRGKVYSRETRELLVAVTVKNTTQNRFNQSDLGGNYRIPARENDTLVFSSVGFLTDTFLVDHQTLDSSFQVYMRPNVVALAAVRVGNLNNYQIDSLNRREDYADFYKRKFVKLKPGSQGPEDGVGITFSPITYFSEKEKQNRRLKKRLEEEDEDSYIDYKFPRSLVVKLTGLKGDSLWAFMLQYRPSYSYCRNSTQQEMLVYINDSYRKFIRKDTPQ
jgi:hypothetical protein